MTEIEPEEGKNSRFRTRYVWLCILVVCAVLIIVPAARHVVGQETGSIFEPPVALSAFLASVGDRTPSANPKYLPSDLLLDRLAASNSQYEIQLCCALDRENCSRIARRLQALTGRFPSEPSLFAALLRYSSSGIDSSRPEDSRELAAFDAAAARGERIDPGNAYFPWMRAFGLFEAHRNYEALAAVKRAGAATHWSEYERVDEISRCRLHVDAPGDNDTIERWGIHASALYPDMSAMRAVARMAIEQAAAAERAGRVDEGLAIRHAVMRYGSIMRAQSPTAIGSLTAAAIELLASIRPGGAAPIKTTASMSTDDRRKMEQSAYLSYLRKMGQSAEAAWAAKEFDAGRQARAIAKSGMNLTSDPIWDMLKMRMKGMLLLVNFGWFLLAGIATRILRSAKRQWPIAFALFAVGLALLAAAAWSLERREDAEKDVMNVIANLASSYSVSGFGLTLAGIVAVLGTFTLPLCCSALASVICLTRRLEPLKFWSAAASVVALIVLLAYCAVLPQTIRSEARAKYMVDQSSISEGAYMARELHQTWPK